jgi:N-acetylneuraminic acid mutarotase
MIVWGGMTYDPTTNGTNCVNTGARYSPSTDTWVATSIGANVPSSRMRNFAAWTGTKMLVWGGVETHTGASDTWMNSGGQYDPSTDTWTPTSTGVGVPTPRAYPAATWTGSEMIIWAGQQPVTPYAFLNTGSRYSPSTDTWVATAVGASLPSGRSSASAVWTGTEMIVWGGFNNAGYLNSGGRYNPSTGTWSATSMGSNLPAGRYRHTVVWTGAEMIVWGGDNGTFPFLKSGGRYNPATNSWAATSLGPSAPIGRCWHTAIWTGTEMVAWGGYTNSYGHPDENTGGRYSPTTDTWIPTSLGGTPPAGRDRHSAVWTGSEMIVWGGQFNSGPMNSGGRYIPAIDTWFPTSTGTDVPSARLDHTAVWTGHEMIVWGGNGPGFSFPADGGRYNPATDTWAATSLNGAPQPRSHNEAVWTGTEMIVWGGFNSNDSQNTGGRYDPTTNTWKATPVEGEVPAPRYFAASVWTGKEMIVWGGLGLQQGELLQTGGLYDPSADGWTATAVSDDTPNGRYSHTAVWTGREMIVWGGHDDKPGPVATGSRFDPETNKWTRIATAPIGAAFHTAVWTGAEMIEWGGVGPQSSSSDQGSRYDPSLNRWTPTAGGSGLPAGRNEHSAVWTGTEMVVWGGNYYQTYLNTVGSYCAASCAVPIVYYQDRDGDGRGDPTMSIQACDQPSGYAAIAGDCADHDANTYPGAPEVKDGIDNQCFADGGFGEIDEISGPTWWEGSTYRWTAQALATQYQLLRAGTASFSSGCVMFTSSAPSVDETSDPDPGGAFFYLVRSSAPGIAGSWGQRADGHERSPDCQLPN